MFSLWGAKAQDTLQKKFTFGAEYDFMAPRIGQWHSFNIGGWMGRGHLKHSVVFAHIEINSRHLTEEAFTEDRFFLFGYRAEYFFSKKLKGFSTGGMLLFSMNHVVTSPNLQEGTFNTLYAGLPLSFTFRLWNHLTIRPNISILVPLINRNLRIGIDEVEQAPWGLEPGLSIGYQF